MKTALVVIDMQEAMFRQPQPPDDGAAVVDRIAGLLARARAGRLPVYHVQHDGGPGDEFEHGTPTWQIHPPLAPEAGEPVIEKRHPSAFQDTGFDETLKTAGIERLVVCGMQTDYCVNATVRAGFDIGYRIVLVSDAHSTFDSGEETAAEIRSRINRELDGSFAECVPAAEVTF